jgi:hypothetical protein
MAYIDKIKWVYFLFRVMHIKQIGKDSKCWKKESRKIAAWRPKKTRWCIPWIFFSPIYFRVSACGICNPGMSRDAELKGSNAILLSIVKRPRKRKVE